MKSTLLTIIALITIVAGFVVLSDMGHKYAQHQQAEAQFGHLVGTRPTLEEMHDYADSLGLPRMERLPWIDEQGRDIYEFRQAELERLGLEGYIEQYVVPYEAAIALEE